MTMHVSSSVLDIPMQGKKDSTLRRLMDAMREARMRQAAHQLATYLEDHKHSLKAGVRAELEHRLKKLNSEIGLQL
jgi:hypothetical protein